jgi:ketosteroid isomerase-like protein
VTASDFDDVVEQYHRALDEMVKGNAEGYKKMYSRRDDVTLANPFGPPVRGWEHVAPALERAGTIFREGEATGFERVVTCITPNLAYIVEVERSQSRVGGADTISPIALRVTTIFRSEEGTWKVVHRHADPITTPRTPESVTQQ